MSTDPDVFLGRLLDRAEVRPDRRNRLIADVPAFDNVADRDAFGKRIGEAERHGAVRRLWGKGPTAHQMQRVEMTDAAALGGLLGRKPLSERIEAGVAAVLAVPLRTAEALVARDHFVARWRERNDAVLGFDDPAQAVDTFQIIDALYARAPDDGSDMTSFSRRALGAAKRLDRGKGKACTVLKKAGLVQAEAEEDEIMASFGLSKFPPIQIMAGPLSVRGVELSPLTAFGVSPRDSAHIRASRPLRWILSIENYASFNAHVLEAGCADGVVAYTGGWPSRSLTAILRRLADETGAAVFHWGDIDPAGVAIGHHMHAHCGAMPHLMTVDIAVASGSPPAARRAVMRCPKASPFAGVSRYLERADANYLEQEQMAPAIPPV